MLVVTFNVKQLLSALDKSYINLIQGPSCELREPTFLACVFVLYTHYSLTSPQNMLSQESSWLFITRNLRCDRNIRRKKKTPTKNATFAEALQTLACPRPTP